MITYIQAQRLTHFYGQTCALDNVSFNVCPGDSVAVIGKNGAGKSTLLKLIAGLIPSPAANILFSGVALQQQPQRVKNFIGFLGDRPALHYDVRVNEFLKFCGELRGMRGKVLQQHISKVIETCHLKEFGNTLISLLSSGYQQRVGIAQAILHNPKVLILDEPTARLDPTHIDEFRTLIRELANDRAILLATHIAGDITSMCSRILLLEKGQLAFDGAAKTLLQNSLQGEIEIIFNHPPGVEELKLLSGVTHVKQTQDGHFKIECSDRINALNHIVLIANQKNWGLQNVTQTENSLRSFFEKREQS